MLVINEEKCVGCAQCVPFCPREALAAWGLCAVQRVRCDDCLVCLEYCPVDALELSHEAG